MARVASSRSVLGRPRGVSSGLLADGHGLAASASLRGALARDEVAEIQRSRLLAGAVGAIEEHGYAQLTVAQITSRARVSRRTFYELFEDRDACLAALIEEVVTLIERELVAAGLEGMAWRERIRGGLLVILSFFDRQPALARVCVVHALRGSARVLELRAGILARLARVLDEGRAEGAGGSGCTTLTAEGLVGAAFGIVHARLLRGERKPLTGLLGELMGMIVLPYQGPGAARREQAKRPVRARPVVVGGALVLAASDGDPLQNLPMRLTYRTTMVLQGIAAQPGASNREIADHAGISDQGQVSKLLARLQRLGLVTNAGEGHLLKGERNAWTLTELGRQVAQRLHTTAIGRGAAAA
jgi:AcrR family transcriptional regulator